MWKPEDDGFARIAFAAMSSEPAEDRGARMREAWEPAAQDEIFRRAVANEIAPHVAHALRDAYGDAVDPRWTAAHDETERRISAYMKVLDRVSARLGEAGIPLVGLKNAGIARGIYPCLGCSPMGDLDVLVSRNDFRRAHRILIEDGFEVEFRSPLEEATLEAGERGGGMEYRTRLDDGSDLWFELQWRPVSGRWIRPDQEPSGDALIARSHPIPGTAVRLLDPVDNLLQVCLHTAKHSYVRPPGLRLHTDVDRIVRHQTIDWDAFVKRVAETNVRTACYFSLAIPAETLGTPVPSEALDALRPAKRRERAIRGHLGRAGLLDPRPDKFGNVAYIHFNASMYDDAAGLLRAVFPDGRWMKERYEFEATWALPWYHAKRIGSLIFRRTI